VIVATLILLLYANFLFLGYPTPNFPDDLYTALYEEATTEFLTYTAGKALVIQFSYISYIAIVVLSLPRSI